MLVYQKITPQTMSEDASQKKHKVKLQPLNIY